MSQNLSEQYWEEWKKIAYYILMKYIISSRDSFRVTKWQRLMKPHQNPMINSFCRLRVNYTEHRKLEPCSSFFFFLGHVSNRLKMLSQTFSMSSKDFILIPS